MKLNIGCGKTNLDGYVNVDIIESADVNPAPLRMVLGSQALEGTLATLRKRIASFEAQTDLAASTDFPPGV